MGNQFVPIPVPHHGGGSSGGGFNQQQDQIAIIKAQVAAAQRQDTTDTAYVIAALLTKKFLGIVAGPAFGPTSAENAAYQQQQNAQQAAQNTVPQLQQQLQDARQNTAAAVAAADVIAAQQQAARQAAGVNQVNAALRAAMAAEINEALDVVRIAAGQEEQLAAQLAQAEAQAANGGRRVSSFRPNAAGISATVGQTAADLGIVGVSVKAIKSNQQLAELQVLLNRLEGQAGIPLADRTPANGINPLLIAEQLLERGAGQGGVVADASAFAYLNLRILLGSYASPPEQGLAGILANARTFDGSIGFDPPPPMMTIGGLAKAIRDP